MNRDVGSTVTTGKLANAPATCDTSQTLVVRRPDDESHPEVPVMVLRSHSRGGRSSACASEPDSQAGSFPIGIENLRVQPTRQGKSRPEPEIPSSHGMGPNSPLLGNNPTGNPRKTFSDNRSEAPTEQPEVVAGPNTSHHPRSEVFTGSHTGNDSVGGSNTTSGPTLIGNTIDDAR